MMTMESCKWSAARFPSSIISRPRNKHPSLPRLAKRQLPKSTLCIINARALAAASTRNRKQTEEWAQQDYLALLGDDGGNAQEKGTMEWVPDHLLPKVAIVGRPNVGKSALFNRLAGGDVAIVNDEPGVTRDRLYARGFWERHEFMLVDTGGVLTVPKSGSLGTDGVAITGGGGQNAITQAVKEAHIAGLPSMIERQAAAALEDTSVIIFVVDGQEGLSSVDVDIGHWLRKNHSDKLIVLAVNKCESPTKGLLQTTEFWALGLEPIAVSAISGTGTGDLLDLVCSGLRPLQVEEGTMNDENRIPAIAIVGKPNVGKSSILNALAGEERVIVSPVSGTTRDAIDTDITGPDGQVYRLIDTAGIRRRAAVASTGSKTEELSVNRAFRAIRRSDVVALVIDAMSCVTEQDYKLGERIEKEGKGCVIVINKWDTIPEKDNKTVTYYEQDVREKLQVLDWAPIVYTSIKTGQRVYRILETAMEVNKERSRRLSTALLNQVVQEAMALSPPPRTRGGKKGRLYYCTQAAVRPPTFVFFVNEAKLFSDIYRRYMEKQIRANVGYHGTPIRLLWRSKKKSGHDAVPNEASSAESTR